MNIFKNEEGFTFIEILVSMVLLSVLGVTIWTGLISSQGLIRKIISEASMSAKILQLDNFVRQHVNQVKIPFWEGKIKAEAVESGLAIPYLNSDYEDMLIFKISRDMLLIGSKKTGQFTAFGPFNDIGFQLWEGDEEKLLGVKLSVSFGTKVDNNVIIYARFGGNPL
jgi:prepilin-type N-terminal cleavage/methylation domain-containing protein